MHYKKLILALSFSIFSACDPRDCEADAIGDTGAVKCDAMGRTCESAFGQFVIVHQPLEGCSLPSSLPPTLTLAQFDGGTGVVNWYGAPSLRVDRQGCQYVMPYSTSSSTIEFTYAPDCNVLKGKVRLWSNTCDAGSPTWFSVVATKP